MGSDLIPGSREDPEWAWYWQEADSDDFGYFSRSFYPNGDFREGLITESLESGSLRDPNPVFPGKFREVALWLPKRLRIPLIKQYDAGGPRRWCRAYKDLGIPQSTWADRVGQGEKMIIYLAPFLRDTTGPGCSPAKAALRSEWPKVFRAYVEEGSTLRASAILPNCQAVVHKRVRKMSGEDPILKALMDWRQRDPEKKRPLHDAVNRTWRKYRGDS